MTNFKSGCPYRSQEKSDPKKRDFFQGLPFPQMAGVEKLKM
jgi:hypothetical protein